MCHIFISSCILVKNELKSYQHILHYYHILFFEIILRSHPISVYCINVNPDSGFTLGTSSIRCMRRTTMKVLQKDVASNCVSLSP